MSVAPPFRVLLPLQLCFGLVVEEFLFSHSLLWSPRGPHLQKRHFEGQIVFAVRRR